MSTNRTAVSCRRLCVRHSAALEAALGGVLRAPAPRPWAPPAAANAAAIRSAPGRSSIAWLHRLPEPVRRQPPCGKPHAGARDLDAASDLGLVAPEGNRDDRHAVGERLLGDPHAGVADDAGRALEQRRVREEALDADVGRRGQAGRVDVGGRDDDVERLAGERGAGDLGEPAVVLEQRRAGDEHERLLELSSQAGGSAGGSQRPGPTSRELGRPVRARVLERLGRVGDHDEAAR